MLLVHGAWHGAWCWRDVLPLLPGARAIDLAGCGARAEDPAVVTLSDHGDDIARHAARVVVAHSYGGCALNQALADGAEIEHAIYLDALAPDAGEALMEAAPEADRATFQTATECGAPIPIRPREVWPRQWGLTGTHADFAAQHLRPMPPRCFTDAVRGDPGAHPAQRTYIRCTQNISPLFDRYRARAVDRGWAVHDLDAPHCAMVTHPDELAKLLRALS
ncbi:MAG: alpha/beta fold hydrolase [Pseudomonadota bacterium]